jgi:hypothetical protein
MHMFRPRGGPIELSNTAPPRLALVLLLRSGAQMWDERHGLEITCLFQRRGRAVRLVAGEQVICNGVALSNNDSSFDGFAPLAVGSLPNTLRYVRQGTATEVRFTLPPAPVILSPQVGARVPRSPPVTVTYEAGSGEWVQVLAYRDAPAGHPRMPVIQSQPQPDTGVYADFDVHAVEAGPGGLLVCRAFAMRVIDAGEFQSVRIRVWSQTSVPLVWL